MIDKVSPYFLHYINLVPNFFKLILKKNYFLYHIHYQPLPYHTLKKKKKTNCVFPRVEKIPKSISPQIAISLILTYAHYFLILHTTPCPFLQMMRSKQPNNMETQKKKETKKRTRVRGKSVKSETTILIRPVCLWIVLAK